MGDFTATQVFIKMAFTSTTAKQNDLITRNWRAVAWG
jgi:hypothetical protein